MCLSTIHAELSKRMPEQRRVGQSCACYLVQLREGACEWGAAERLAGQNPIVISSTEEQEDQA